MSRTQYQEPESPLGLAEILDVTFLFLSRQELSICSRVNRKWHASANRILYARYELASPESGKQQTLEMLLSTSIKSFPPKSLSGITITRWSSMFDCQLPEIAPNLKWLTFGPSSALPLNDMTRLVKALPSLTSLSILCRPLESINARYGLSRRADAQQGGELDSLLHGLVEPGCTARLTSLKIVSSVSISDEAFVTFLSERGGMLKRLNLNSCTLLSPAAISKIGVFCLNLTELVIHAIKCEAVECLGNPVLFNVLDGCSRLEILNLSAMNIYASISALQAYGVTFGVRELTLSSIPEITSACLRSFGKVNALRINNCTGIKCIPPALLPELRVLSVSGGAVGQMTMLNLFELCMHGHGERALPKIGKRGLRKITLDACRTHQTGFSTPPSCLGSSYGIPQHITYYLDDYIFDWEVPSHIIADILGMAEDLESVALFGMQPLRGRRLTSEDIHRLVTESPSMINVYA